MEELAQIQNRLTLATFDFEQASNQLAEAQQRLRENTDPTKQTELEREVSKAQVALDREGQEVHDLTEKMGNLNPATEKATISLADMKAGLDMALGAFRTIKGAVESVINPTIEYGSQIRDLGSFAGITAEEASRLIQVTDDLGIEFNTLRTAAKGMSENGIQPSVKNLAELADEFNAIQDPVEQSQFLVDKFGARAGPAMAFALRQGSDALIQMGEDAERTGLVVGQDFVDSTEKARLAIDEYEDSIMAAKVALSEHLLPIVTSVVTTGADYVSFWSNATDALIDGRISLMEWQRTGLEVLMTEKTMADATAELREETVDYTAALDAANAGAGDYYQRTTQVVPALQSQEERTHELRYATDQAAGAITYATIEELKLKAAAEEAAIAQAGLKQKFDDLSLAIEGPISDANAGYYQEQKDAGAVIAELTIELDKLKTSHGQVVTSTDDGAEAARNLTIAQYEAQVAAENLKKAQEKLTEDPGDLGLQAAVARAEGAVATSQANVEKWGARVGEVNAQYVIDNSAAIADVEARLADANAAYDANATEHEEATARIVFGMLQQKLAMDGYTAEEIAFLTDVGEEWGIYDTKTANALRNVDAAIAKHGLDANAVVATLHDNIANLPDSKTINIEVRTNYTQYGAEPGPGVPPIAPPGPPDDPNNANDGAF